MLTSSRLIKKALLFAILLLLGASPCSSDTILNGLIEEALKNNPDIQASLARMESAKYRVPQVKSLPDPLISAGYQNDGFDRYTYGQEQGSQWMFSASQQFLFPGKLALKGDMATRDAEALEALHELLKLKTTARIKELYYDLFLAYKNIDLVKGKSEVFARIEDLTLARYSAGKALQQEVLMAQTEKYMLLEKEEMFKQKIQSLEAMLSAALGRQKAASLPFPTPPSYRAFPLTADEAIEIAFQYAPEIKYRSKMIESAETRHQLAKKEFFPDFAVNAGYYNRAGDFKDMWSATATINIPLYARFKQQPAVSESKANINQFKQELAATKLMIAAAVKDNYSMLHSAERLMDIYKNGLISKNSQDMEQALINYSTGKTDAAAVISRLRSLLDYETLYWNQFIEREKAIIRLQAITEGIYRTAGGNK